MSLASTIDRAVSFAHLAATITVFSFLPIGLRAEEPPTFRELNHWARFPVGSWKSVRTTTEILDKDRVVSTTVTDTRTTVVGLEKDRVLLKVEVAVEVAGRRFRSETQTVEHGFLGEGRRQTARARPASQTKIVVEGKEIPCDVHEISISGDSQRTDCKRYIATELCPYVLRRESTTRDADNPTQVQKTVSEVVAMELPFKIDGQIKTVSEERTVETGSRGSTISVDLVNCGVPGGIVSRLQKEVDTQNQLVRRSTVELLEFHVARDDDPVRETRRRRLFHRDRQRVR